MGGAVDWKLNDFGCDDEAYFICRLPEKDTSSTFTFYADELNFNDAEKFCNAKGGHLASAQTKADFQEIANIAKKGQGKAIWIGLNDQRQEGVYMWTDGAKYNRFALDFIEGEPNNWGSGEDCIAFRGDTGDYRLNDFPCAEKFPFICEDRVGELVLVEDKPSTFRSAEQACMKMGGHLASASNMREFSIMRKMSSNANPKDGSFDGPDSVWIGLNDSKQEGKFTFTDGTPYDEKNMVFGEGEPNNFGDGEDCVGLWKQIDWNLNDFPCDAEMAYMCKLPAKRGSPRFVWKDVKGLCVSPDGDEYYEDGLDGRYERDDCLNACLERHPMDLMAVNHQEGECICQGGCRCIETAKSDEKWQVAFSAKVGFAERCDDMDDDDDGSTKCIANKSCEKGFFCSNEKDSWTGGRCERCPREDCDKAYDTDNQVYNCKQRCGHGRGQGLVFYDTPMTWAEAEETCEQTGGNLATVTSLTEYKKLQAFADDKDVAALWIGLTDGEKEGSWEWVTGEALDNDIVDWQEDEPNNFGTGEDCAGLYKAFDYRLNDFPCGQKYPFVCSSKYILIDEEATFKQAETNCRDQGGHLASANTREEFEML